MIRLMPALLLFFLPVLLLHFIVNFSCNGFTPPNYFSCIVLQGNTIAAGDR